MPNTERHANKQGAKCALQRTKQALANAELSDEAIRIIIDRNANGILFGMTFLGGR